MRTTVFMFALACALLVACRSELNPAYCAAHQSDLRCPDTGLGDGGQDTFVSPEAGERTCFGTGVYMVCLQSLPTGTDDITNTITTSPGSGQCAGAQPMGWTSQHQPDACFVIAKTITIGAAAKAQGTR